MAPAESQATPKSQMPSAVLAAGEVRRGSIGARRTQQPQQAQHQQQPVQQQQQQQQHQPQHREQQRGSAVAAPRRRSSRTSGGFAVGTAPLGGPLGRRSSSRSSWNSNKSRGSGALPRGLGQSRPAVRPKTGVPQKQQHQPQWQHQLRQPGEASKKPVLRRRSSSRCSSSSGSKRRNSRVLQSRKRSGSVPGNTAVRQRPLTSRICTAAA